MAEAKLSIPNLCPYHYPSRPLLNKFRHHPAALAKQLWAFRDSILSFIPHIQFISRSYWRHPQNISRKLPKQWTKQIEKERAGDGENSEECGVMQAHKISSTIEGVVNYIKCCWMVKIIIEKQTLKVIGDLYKKRLWNDGDKSMVGVDWRKNEMRMSIK